MNFLYTNNLLTAFISRRHPDRLSDSYHEDFQTHIPIFNIFFAILKVASHHTLPYFRQLFQTEIIHLETCRFAHIQTGY